MQQKVDSVQSYGVRGSTVNHGGFGCHNQKNQSGFQEEIPLGLAETLLKTA